MDHFSIRFISTLEVKKDYTSSLTEPEPLLVGTCTKGPERLRPGEVGVQNRSEGHTVDRSLVEGFRRNR